MDETQNNCVAAIKKHSSERRRTKGIKPIACEWIGPSYVRNLMIYYMVYLHLMFNMFANFSEDREVCDVWMVRLGYCFTPYQRLRPYNGAPLVAFYDTLGIRRTYSRLKPPASPRGVIELHAAFNKTSRNFEIVWIQGSNCTLNPNPVVFCFISCNEMQKVDL